MGRVIQSAPNTPAQPRRQLLRAPKGELSLHASLTWRKPAPHVHVLSVSFVLRRIQPARWKPLEVLLS